MFAVGVSALFLDDVLAVACFACVVAGEDFFSTVFTAGFGVTGATGVTEFGEIAETPSGLAGIGSGSTTGLRAVVALCVCGRTIIGAGLAAGLTGTAVDASGDTSGSTIVGCEDAASCARTAVAGSAADAAIATAAQRVMRFLVIVPY